MLAFVRSAKTDLSSLLQTVFEQLGFTCSAGIAQTKKLAKVVAGMNKPNGQTILLPAHVTQLLGTISYKKIQVGSSKCVLQIDSL